MPLSTLDRKEIICYGKSVPFKRKISLKKLFARGAGVCLFTLLCTSCVWLIPKHIKVQPNQYAPKFVPPNEKVLFIIGQDKLTIDNYVKDIGIMPGGFMVYTSVQKGDGIYTPKDYGGGTQDFQYLADKYPDAVFQVGLYMVDALDEVIQGVYDDNIDKLGDWIKKVNRPVYLRIGYEFDHPINHYQPQKYVEAYWYIVDRLKDNGVQNAAYVWHSAASYREHPLKDWYPGDEYVDWCAISYFSFIFYNKFIDSMLDFAKEHNKPFMIAEATPCGIGTTYPDYAWERWFQHFFNFIAESNTKAVCYINCDWESYPMWQGQGWKDARVQTSEVLKKRWLSEITKEKYLHSSPELFELLGSSPLKN